MADCKREMYVRKLSNGDLAKMTGYKKSTINAFFCDKADREKSRNVAEAIAAVLQVEI
jgi:hypothetical protein